MDTDTRISVIAGRPGAGKTRWAAREVVETLRDVNNVVIYIGFDREFERICRMVSDTYGQQTSRQAPLCTAGWRRGSNRKGRRYRQ